MSKDLLITNEQVLFVTIEKLLLLSLPAAPLPANKKYNNSSN